MREQWKYSMCFSAVCTIALILMILGTGYDYYLSNIVARKKNVIYDLEKHGKLDHLTNGNGKALNGKELHVLKSHSCFVDHTYRYCKITSVQLR